MNRWSDVEAAKYSTPLEQRVYSSRLLGQDADLVMHGGGNTSVKDEVTNILGKKEKVLFVKGSGWDLATIEKPGFPAVRLDHLLALRQLDSLSDPNMVNELRTHLMDSQSPDPSVEALLHAFIPHRFVDHTHADAILTITNQPDGEARIRELFGKKLGIVPYVMPGFQLAKLCIEVFESDPAVEGLVLLRHGIFSFGETAKQAYDRMIGFVQKAEEYVLARKSSKKVLAKSPAHAESEDRKARCMRQLRGALVRQGFTNVLCLDDSEEALRFANAENTPEASQRGPLTPDHIIRTKQLPLYVAANVIAEQRWAQLDEALAKYAEHYRQYFDRNVREKRVERQMLDTLPRVFILPGIGLVTAGATGKDAKIAMDIYRHTVRVITDGNELGKYEALGEGDLFDVEYWVLEQAKLKLGPKKLPLSGKVAVVTGGASGIGRAIAEELLQQGANVQIWDLQESAFDSLKQELKKFCKAGNEIQCSRVDVGRREDVRTALCQTSKLNGGVDIFVANAGIFPSSQTVDALEDREWNRSMEVNLNGAFYSLSEVVRAFKEQGSGGDIVVIGTKNVHAPGKEAAAYSVAKAAQAQLARIVALEAGAFGVRVNLLHPHLIFDTALWSEELIAKRASAYKMTVDQYKRNNLLNTSLSTRDVARATFALVAGYFSKTTGAQIPVDGGSDRTL